MSFLLPQHPTQPMPVQTSRRRSVLGPVLTGQPPVKNPNRRWFCPTQSLKKAPELSACGPKTWGGFQCLAHQALKSFCRDAPLMAKLTASRPDGVSCDVLQSNGKTLALGCACDLQAQVNCPDGDSKPSPQPATQQCGQNSECSIEAWFERSSQIPSRLARIPHKKARLSLSYSSQPRSQWPGLGLTGSSASPSTPGLGSRQATPRDQEDTSPDAQLFFFFPLATQCGLRDLSSPTRDQTCTPWSGGTESYGPPGKSPDVHLWPADSIRLTLPEPSRDLQCPQHPPWTFQGSWTEVSLWDWTSDGRAPNLKCSQLPQEVYTCWSEPSHHRGVWGAGSSVLVSVLCEDLLVSSSHWLCDPSPSPPTRHGRRLNLKSHVIGWDWKTEDWKDVGAPVSGESALPHVVPVQLLELQIRLGTKGQTLSLNFVNSCCI